MSEIILDKEGNEVEVYTSSSSGFVDAVCRATTEEAWVKAALHQNLLELKKETVTNIITPAVYETRTEVEELSVRQYQYDEEDEPILDEEGNHTFKRVVYDTLEHTYEELVTPAVTEEVVVREWLEPVPGANISVLGAVVLTEGEYDEDGLEVTPPVIDGRYHVNLRISEPLLSSVDEDGFEKWKTTAINWTRYGTVEEGNSKEVGKKLSDVTLIDPDTINSTSRRWA